MTVTRAALTVSLTLGLLVAALAAQAQPAGRVPLIGILEPGATPHPIVFTVFLEGLRELGYVEGKTIRLEWRFGDSKPERYPGLFAELVRLKPEILLRATGAG